MPVNHFFYHITLIGPQRLQLFFWKYLRRYRRTEVRMKVVYLRTEVQYVATVCSYVPSFGT